MAILSPSETKWLRVFEHPPLAPVLGTFQLNRIVLLQKKPTVQSGDLSRLKALASGALGRMSLVPFPGPGDSVQSLMVQNGTGDTSARRAALATNMLPGAIQDVGVIFETLHGLREGYLQNHLSLDISTHPIGSSRRGTCFRSHQLQHPRRKAFSFMAYALWNIIPLESRMALTVCGVPQSLEGLVLCSSLGALCV